MIALAFDEICFYGANSSAKKPPMRNDERDVSEVPKFLLDIASRLV
jgi:hypothetical protein